jgi:hypothetical protein
MSELTKLLFASPSFLEGVGRIVDFGGTLTEYNRSPSGAVADYVALACDWRAVGNDLKNVVEVEVRGVEANP